VLYFGTEHPWDAPKKLSDCFEIPEELEPYFSDYQINVFDIAFLPDETIEQFESDFRIVADYFSQIRKNKDYIPSTEQIDHVDAVLKLMSVMTGDDRFTEAQQVEEREVHNMCEVMDRIEQRGISQGRMEGRAGLIQTMLRDGKRPEAIAEFCNISLDEVKQVEEAMLTTV
jgi:hypothetical protein